MSFGRRNDSFRRQEGIRRKYIKNSSGMAVCGDFSSTEAECDVVIVLNVVFAIFFFPLNFSLMKNFMSY